MFSTPRYNPLTTEIASRLEKAGIDLSTSNLGNPIWHMDGPEHDMIIEELQNLKESNIDALKRVIIASEIVTLNIKARGDVLRSFHNDILGTDSMYNPENAQELFTRIDEEADALYTSSSQVAEQDDTVKPFGESTDSLSS